MIEPGPHPEKSRAPRSDSAPGRTITAVVALEVVLVVGVALIARWRFVGQPLSPDEAGYALGAYWWAQGDVLYSADLWFDRPQGIFVAYRFGMALFGDSPWGIRAWGSVWVAAGAIAVWRLTRDLARSRLAAIMSGIVFGVVSASPFVEGQTSNAETFMTPAMTVAALFIWHQRWGWAGLVTGIAILLKPSGATVGLLALAMLAHTRAGARAWAVYCFVSAVPLVVAGLHGAATVGASTYVDAAIGFRLHHPVPDQWLRAGVGLLIASPTLGLLIVAIALSVAFVEARSRNLLVAFTATSALGVSSGGNYFPHYFIQLLPALAVLLGAAAPGAIRRGRPAIQVLVGFTSFTAVVLNLLTLVFTTTDGSTNGRVRPWVVADVAEHMRTRSGVDDRIYVAFSDPNVNYLAKRRSAVPWLYPQPLEEVDGALDALTASIRDGVPVFVAVMNPSPVHPRTEAQFMAALEERYVIDATFEGGTRVYRRAR